MKELDKAQAKLLQSTLHLPKFCHNTPLLKALALKKIAKTLQVQLSLLRNALFNNSKARTFYMYMIKRGTTQSDKNLITRCFNIRKTHHVSLMRYMYSMNAMPIRARNKYTVYHRVLRTLITNIIEQLQSTLEANS